MENKEDYVGYEDQELCNRYYKEAEAMRQKQDWSRLRAVPAPAKGTPSPGWGQLAAYGIAHKNRSVQGFLTSKNRFLTREEASELVRNNNQEMVVDRNAIREQLYSEDLY